MKDNKTPQEAGLKLLWQPRKPENGVNMITFDTVRDDWNMFLGKDK